MELGLKGKAALVTASSQGIGKACGLALAESGADLVICARGEEALETTRDEIADATGRKVAAVRADLTSKDDIDALIARAVREVVRRFLDLGVDEISLGDTLGRASTDQVERLLEQVLPEAGADRLILHFHDTFGRASDNVRVAWRLGIRAFDSSAGGLGGCPYAPAATGNIATETLVHTLEDLGAETGVDAERVTRAVELLGPRICQAPEVQRAQA